MTPIRMVDCSLEAVVAVHIFTFTHTWTSPPPPDPAPPGGHVVPPVTDRSMLLGGWVVGKRCLHYKTSCWAVSSEVARLTDRPYWLWPRATPGATLTGIVGDRSRPCSRPPPRRGLPSVVGLRLGKGGRRSKLTCSSLSEDWPPATSAHLTRRAHPLGRVSK